jgi:mRNA deadenylase 3'-5' endonuclease subunit Ccr4
MAFTVVTYNVLATSYIKPHWYPFTPSEILNPQHRIPAVAEHLARLHADILCLQEVEDPMFVAIMRRLSLLGYVGEFTQKGLGRPDGCATFIQTSSFKVTRVTSLIYHDGDGDRPASGHVAQVLALRAGEGLLGLCNTHLKWDPPQTPKEKQFGYRQIVQLLNERTLLTPPCTAWVICGDFNTTVDGRVIEALWEAGFQFSHVSSPGPTCNSNRRAKMIDYLFHDGALRAKPLPLPQVTDNTPLPGSEQPSDHVAVLAEFEWNYPHPGQRG